MNLKQLKSHFENMDSNEKLDYSLSNPFSWRGSYDEVAFDIEEKPSTPKENLDKIKEAYNETFYGYKGGEFTFDDCTSINFEQDTGSYTDGGYCEKLISELLDIEKVETPQERLVKLAFRVA